MPAWWRNGSGRAAWTCTPTPERRATNPHRSNRRSSRTGSRRSSRRLRSYGLSGAIEAGLQAEVGRALCVWGDAGWGSLVRRGKYDDGRFSDELVAACVEMIQRWNPEPRPTWVTCVPSLRHPGLVPDFARRLADALGLPFESVLVRTDDRPEQKSMANSTQQARNVDGSLAVRGSGPRAAVLLVDDMVDSRWTLTMAAWRLRSHGSGHVWPLALAQAGAGQ
jgi:ATP-dependent DNA helicase RecQ